MANTDPYVLDYTSCTYVPTKACDEVLVCLSPEWAAKTVSGYAFVFAKVKESGRFLGSRGRKQTAQFENVRGNGKYQYSLTINPADFLESMPGHPHRLTCKDINDLFPYTCFSKRIIDAIESLELGTSGTHTDITGIDLTPTANPNEFTVTLTWVDSSGTPQTTTDATPITIAQSDCSWTVNAGTTAVVTDDSLGTATMTCDDTLHFWSPDSSIDFSVTQGSAIVGAIVSTALQNTIAANTAAAAANAANILSNTNDITNNAANIATNSTAVVANTAATLSNAANIATNTTNIATNVTDIAANTTGVSNNAAAIALNTTATAANAALIAALDLNDLVDVDTSTTTPTTGDALVWNGTVWEPAAVSGGGGFTGTPNRVTATDASGNVETIEIESLNGRIQPVTDSTYYLGWVNQRWLNVFSDELNASLRVLTPELRNNGDLDIIANSGRIYMYAGASTTNPIVEVNNSGIRPGSNNSYYLGWPNQEWLGLFVGTGGATFDGTIQPKSNNTVDLGTNSLRWRDIYTVGPVTTFTGAHIYEVDLDTNTPQAGDAVILVNRKLQKSTKADDKRVIGIMMEREYRASEELLPAAEGEEPVVQVNKVRDSFDQETDDESRLFTAVAAIGDSKASGLQGANLSDEGGDIEDGDLLTSASKPGFLKKQEDDIVRAKTVGQAREDVKFKNGEAKGAYIYLLK